MTKTAVIIACALLIATINAADSAPARIYACPECGCPADNKTFDQPGNCPSCGMKLIEVKDRHEVEMRAAQPVSVFHFPEGADSVQFPFELLANSIFFPVRVNGKGPFLFNLDTGSFNSVIASEAAAEVGIETNGTSTGSGAGAGSFAVGKIKELQFEFPQGLNASTRAGATVSMSALWPLIGRRFYGDVGHDIIEHFVVEIDYERKLLTFYDPAKYRYTGPGKVLPFTLWGNYDPQIDGEISVAGEPPIPVKLTLDTGGGGTAVTTPLVEEHLLREKVGKVIPAFDNGIGGGQPKLVFARLGGLRVGPFQIDQPLAALTSDRQGSFASKTLGVNLGGNILRRFAIIIDYPNKLLALEPNSHLHDPFEADASGLILKAEGEDFRRFTVRAVIADSPATEVGIQPGDILSAIDGESLERYALWQVQELLQKSGVTCNLSIKRGEKAFNCTLKLRSLL